MKSEAKEKTGTKEKENSREQEKLMSEMASQARKNYEQAVRTGLKLQEEAAQWWTSIASQTAPTQDWQKRFASLASLANSSLPAAQRRVEELVELMERNSRQSVELMKKAAEAAQSQAIAESQAKWMDVWTESLKVPRGNAEDVMQIGNKAIDSWLDYVRKNVDVTQTA